MDATENTWVEGYADGGTQDRLLAHREKAHGPFAEKSEFIQDVKTLMRASPGWERLTPAMQEALDMDIVKSGRILFGDPFERDHWRDKAGYIRLVERELANSTKPQPRETKRERDHYEK